MRWALSLGYHWLNLLVVGCADDQDPAGETQWEQDQGQGWREYD